MPWGLILYRFGFSEILHNCEISIQQVKIALSA